MLHIISCISSHWHCYYCYYFDALFEYLVHQSKTIFLTNVSYIVIFTYLKSLCLHGIEMILIAKYQFSVNWLQCIESLVLQHINIWMIGLLITWLESVFGQQLNDWNVANVTRMFWLFSGAKSYNQPTVFERFHYFID